jgi:TRAP-type mannitol/chloroaromatic compound transport system substrate-binding protein
MSDRRRFLAKVPGAVAAAAAAAFTDIPSVIAQPKIQWRMSTTWTPALESLQGSARRLAKVIEEMSGGRLRIEVFPGGQIMPPLECFDAASRGAIEAVHGRSSLLRAPTSTPPSSGVCSTPPNGLARTMTCCSASTRRLATTIQGSQEVGAADVVREESEKTPTARRVHASFTKFQALVGPWDRLAGGAYHQFVAP